MLLILMFYCFLQKGVTRTILVSIQAFENIRASMYNTVINNSTKNRSDTYLQ